MTNILSNYPDLLFKLTEDGFERTALEIFHFQAEKNPVYRSFLDALDRDMDGINSLGDIPFMPVELFQGHRIRSGRWNPEKIFMSSGTTGTQSRHELYSERAYSDISRHIFQMHYGPLNEYAVLALLPSYLERDNSSLVHMVKEFIEASQCDLSGFFLNEQEKLLERIAEARDSGKKVLLIGVTFALLDLAEKYPVDLSDVMIMETGGMKGRREELTREEVHRILAEAFGVETVHSEYGMTELLSQAYSSGSGLFETPPWARVYIRELNDPFSRPDHGRVGAIDWIDLANAPTCSFISTSDLGRIHGEDTFEVLGRVDNSDVRGCNLMMFN